MTTIAPIEPRRVTVGVDTHLDAHTAVAMDQLGRTIDRLVIASNPAGYRQLFDWAQGFGEVENFGVEGTGSYGAGLSRFLLGEGQEVIEVDRPNRKARRLKGKSDPLDAEQAARQVLCGVASARPKSRDGEAEMLRALKVARSSAVKATTQATNSLKALVVSAPEQLRERLRKLGTGQLVDVCASFRPGGFTGVEAATKTALRSLAQRVEFLKGEAKNLDVAISALANAAAPELIKIFGAGPDVASTLLIAAGDNPDRLGSEAGLASLCGVSPIPASSGKTSRHRLNRSGNRQANAAIHRIVIVRLRYDDKTKAYLERRCAEGKTKKEIIRCLKRYVVREVFAALKAMSIRRAAMA